MELKIRSNRWALDSDAHHSILKMVALAVVTVFFAFTLSYFLKVFFGTGNLSSLIILLLSAVGFLTLFLLNVVFIKTMWRSNLIIASESIGLLLGFWDEFSFGLLLGCFFVFLLLVLANYSGTSELENMLKIKVWKVGKRALPKAMLALSLFISLIYYLALNRNLALWPNNFFISEQTFEKVIFPTEPFIQKFFPQFEFQVTTDEFLHRLAESQVDEAVKSQNVGKLPDSLKAELIAKSASDLGGKFASSLGIQLESQDTVAGTLYKALVQRIMLLPSNVHDALPLILAAVVFLLIISLGWLLRWVSSVLAFLIYKLLMYAGFAQLVLEGRSREIAILK